MFKKKTNAVDGRRNDYHEDKTDLLFKPREEDRRKNETATSGEKFYTRKVGDRIVAGRERRSGNRRNELIDATHITLTNKDGSRYRII